MSKGKQVALVVLALAAKSAFTATIGTVTAYYVRKALLEADKKV
jgi:hypothetical protein